MIALALIAAVAAAQLTHEGHTYPLYPAVTAECPGLPSPLVAADGREYVVIRLRGGSFGVADVTIADHPEQCRIDARDFPTLARTGLHDPAELAATEAITGRAVAEIDRLAAPGALSTGGFIADDETILSVLHGDNELVRAMGLTHAELARPLFHVWNLMAIDLELDRWSMPHHQWRNVSALKYHDRWVLLDAHDTKGGQRSPFADGLEGGFWIVIRRALDTDEAELLHDRYAGVPPTGWDTMHGTLTRLWIGEMEAHYIQWYGFYEGHTDWRADPLGIAHVFGLRTLEELETAFPKQLANVTTRHHTAASR